MTVDHMPADFCPHMAGHLFITQRPPRRFFFGCSVKCLPRKAVRLRINCPALRAGPGLSVHLRTFRTPSVAGGTDVGMGYGEDYCLP